MDRARFFKCLSNYLYYLKIVP